MDYLLPDFGKLNTLWNLVWVSLFIHTCFPLAFSVRAYAFVWMRDKKADTFATIYVLANLLPYLFFFVTVLAKVYAYTVDDYDKSLLNYPYILVIATCFFSTLSYVRITKQITDPEDVL